MEAILEIIRNLVFAGIAISVIEMLLPDSPLKKYLNYIGAIVFLAMMLGSFYNIYRGRDGILEGLKFQSGVEEKIKKSEKRFTENFETDKKFFFEQNMQAFISQSIQDFVERHYKKTGLEVQAEFSIPENFKELAVKNIRIYGLDKGILDKEFFSYVKENFNLEESAIVLSQGEGENR